MSFKTLLLQPVISYNAGDFDLYIGDPMTEQKKKRQSRACSAKSRPPNFEDMLLKVLEELKPTLIRFSSRLLKDKEAAVEIFSEVSVRAFREAQRDRINSYEHIPLRVWLFRIARNLCYDNNDQAYVRRRADMSERFVAAHNPEDEALSNEIFETILDAIEDLPGDYRLPVLLCRVEQLKAREAAEALCLTVPAFKARLYRGTALLRQMLKRADGGVSYHKRRTASRRVYAPLVITAAPLPPSDPTEETNTHMNGRTTVHRQPKFSGEKRPGVRPDTPAWFHSEDTPYKSGRELARMLAAADPDLTLGYAQKMIWYAFNAQSVTPQNIERIVRAVESDLDQRGILVRQHNRVIKSLRRAITPK